MIAIPRYADNGEYSHTEVIDSQGNVICPELPVFKIRCSEIGKIMTPCPANITEKQLATITELEGKNRTEKQEAEYQRLCAKRDLPPQLSEGAKTYCMNWLHDQIYNRTIQFSGKYTEKGILCEPQSIEIIAERFGYGMVEKNEVRYSNEYMEGTPDLITADWIDDAKNSWSHRTFPLFETELPNTDYFWQGVGYCHLVGRKRFRINYTLINAPEVLIDREARTASFKAGLDEVDMELYDEVRAKMTYDGIPIELRHKYWEFDYDPALAEQVNERVKMCRAFIASVLSNPVMLARYDQPAGAVRVE